MKKFLSLLLVLCAAITISAGNIDQGTFKNGGSWRISNTGELYVDATSIPDYKYQRSSNGYINLGKMGYNVLLPEDCYVTTAPWSWYSSHIKSIKLSSRVAKIGTYAFAGLSEVKSVKCESGTGTIEIGNNAFATCFNLESFDFSRVATIGSNAFYYCCNLYHPVFPELQSVGEDAFEMCWRMVSDDIYLTTSNVVLGLADMRHRTSALTVTTPDETSFIVVKSPSGRIVVNPQKISSYQTKYSSLAFAAGDDTWNLKTSDGVLHITKALPDYEAETNQPWWSLRNNIRSVVFEYTDYGSGFRISKNAFKGLTNLETFWGFPDAVTNYSISEGAFDGCTKLNNLRGAEQKATSIGNNAFRNTHLTSINLKSVTTIGDNAFKGAPIYNLSLGSSLTSIGLNAFQGAFEEGGDIYVFSDVPTTGSSAFSTADVNNTTLYATGDIVSGYLTTAPWSLFQLDQSTAFPISGTFGAGYGTWEISEDGTLTIDNTKSTTYDRSIPDYANINNQPWYSCQKFIRKVVLTNKIQGIGKNAFAFATTGKSSIHSIEAPAVTTIGENAFKNNDVLKSFIGEKVRTIGSEAFANCAALEEAKFGEEITSMGSKVFDGCTKIEELGVDAMTPPTVTAQTFVGMGAQSAGAPGRNGVRKATGQKSVTLEVPESAVVTYANTLYWNLFSMDYIGEHGTIVAGDVFGNGMWVLYADSTLMVSCSSLETGSGIQDKTSMHNWGTYADKIKRIEVLGELPELYRSFNNLPNLESVSFSSSVKKLYSTFYNCPKLKEVPLSSVEEFREYGNVGCFEKCNALTEVKLQSARVIGYRCFAECASLKTVEFPNADTIANVAFVSCPKLESVTANNAYIGNAFRGCTGLKEVTLNGVKDQTIPDEAFRGCTSLHTIRIYGSLHSVKSNAFNGTALTDIYLSSPYPAEVANKNNSNVFYGLTLSNINLHVPADFVARYSASYNNPIWSQMNVVADTDYSEALVPTGGSLGSNGAWQLGTDQKLVINCSDSMPTAQVAFGLDDYSSTWFDWMPYVNNIEFSKTTSSVAANAFGLYLADNNFAKVGTITLGAGMRKLDDRALFVKLSNGANVYCYAEEPPVLNGNNCFNWSEVTNANVTLHVLTKSGVLAKYQNAAGWQNFPNIVADLGPRYKVTWDAHNGYIKVDESGIDLNSVPAGTTIHLTAVPYYGYWLKKWINYNPNTGLTVNSDVTVGAQFTTNHVVSFMKPSETFAGQWTVIKRDTVEEGTAATAPADPVREGYRFTGWDCSFDSIVKQTAVHALFQKLVKVESIDITPSIKSIQVSSAELGTKTIQFYATVKPGNVDNSAVTWSTDDQTVATVDANGLATIHDFGNVHIIATAADGSNVSAEALIGVFDSEYVPIIPGTAIAVEGGISEITMTKNQSARVVSLVVTPENYNGSISAFHGAVQVHPCGEGSKSLPAFYIKPMEGQNCPYTDTVIFRMNDYEGSRMPSCTLVVKVTDDVIFTAKTIEGVDMTFRITDPEAMTCEVYGYMEQLMEPDPVTHMPFVLHPAVDASTTGKITVPAVAKGCTVTHLARQAFAGCSALQEIELENGIQYIYMGAFEECSALQKLILPKSLKGIGMLGGMPQLANVYMYNPEPPIGWEIAENGENMMPDVAMTNAFQMIAANATLHVARGYRQAYNKTPWTTWFTTITDDVDASFTVRFVDWDDSEIELQHVDYCAAAAPSQTPVREGHTFIGWDKDFSRVVANMTVKAQYEAMTYSVTFLNWDGTQLGATQQVTYGQAAVAPSVPARSGYTFAGWSADFSKVTSNLTVKAMFAKEGQYLVTFIDWDETTLKCEIVDAGGSATAPEDPVREGYVFTGWSGSYTNVHADAIIRALYTEGTGIEEIFTRPNAPSAIKVLIDGQVYILRNDGAIFDVRGVRVK